MLTIEQKAKAFDLINTGQITVNGIIWENFSALQELSGNQRAEMIVSALCSKAINQVFLSEVED